jgi:hypothetical protein
MKYASINTVHESVQILPKISLWGGYLHLKGNYQEAFRDEE